MNIKTQITDEQLQKKLEESYLSAKHKVHLLKLLPVMNQKDKEHLMDLIKKAKNTDAQIKDGVRAYHRGIDELNKEYTGKMKKLAQDEAKFARSAYEKMAQKREEKELEKMMNEI